MCRFIRQPRGWKYRYNAVCCAQPLTRANVVPHVTGDIEPGFSRSVIEMKNNILELIFGRVPVKAARVPWLRACVTIRIYSRSGWRCSAMTNGPRAEAVGKPRVNFR